MDFIWFLIYSLQKSYSSEGKLRDFRVFITISVIVLCYLFAIFYWFYDYNKDVQDFLHYKEQQSFFVKRFVLSPMIAFPYLLIMFFLTLIFKKKIKRNVLEFENNVEKQKKYKKIHVVYFVISGPVSIGLSLVLLYLFKTK